MQKKGYVYIITNKPRGTLYIGVTSNLLQRAYQHKEKAAPGFTSKYNLTRVVYYEICESIYGAINREKQLKDWRRSWKIELIEKHNPEWANLIESLN